MPDTVRPRPSRQGELKRGAGYHNFRQELASQNLGYQTPKGGAGSDAAHPPSGFRRAVKRAEACKGLSNRLGHLGFSEGVGRVAQTLQQAFLVQGHTQLLI